MARANGVVYLHDDPAIRAILGLGGPIQLTGQGLPVLDEEQSKPEDLGPKGEAQREKEVDEAIEEYDDAVDVANGAERAREQAFEGGLTLGRDELAEAARKRIEAARRLREALERERRVEKQAEDKANEDGKTDDADRFRLIRIRDRIRRIKEALKRGGKSP